MATHRQCGCSSVSRFMQLAKAFSFSSSLPLMTFMQRISLLLFAFLSLAHSRTTEPSSYSSVAASSPQIYTLHEQEEPSITKPFIYETVVASSPAGSFLMHADFPRKKEALILLDDGQDHASKEEAPITAPAFIYMSVAASFSSRLHAENSHQHENVRPQDAEAALLNDGEHGFLSDDGGKHVDTVEKGAISITSKPFIYETVAAQFHIALDHAAGGSRQHDNVSHQENSSLLDDDGKNVHESQPAAAVASTQDAGKLLQDHVPQESYTFLHDDDGRKKQISSTHHDGNNFKVLLIDTKPKEEKSQSIIHDIDVKKSLNVQENKSPAKAPPSLLHDNVPQGKHAFHVDDGGMKHVEYDSPVALSKEVDIQFAKEEEHVLHDNASQGEYSSLLDDGGRKELHSNKLLKDKDDNIKNHKKLIYHKLLRMVVGDSSRNMQIKNANEESLRMEEEDSSNKMIHEELHPMTDAGIAESQKGNLRMVVSDSSNNMTHKGAVVSHKEGSEDNLRMVVGDSTNNMIEKGSRVRDRKGNSNEERLRIVVGDSSSKMVHKGDGVEGNPPDEEILRMVVGVSSNNMMQTGYKVQGNPSKEENLRMVVGDSSKSMVQEGHGSPPKSEDNLGMVVDYTSNNMIKKGPVGARGGRLRLCTSLPVICVELAHAAHMNQIALYGLPPVPTPDETQPACCGDLCVDLNTDQLNCGSCGQPCALLQTCCNGNCIDLNTDSLNCGQCGNSCPDPLLNPCQFGMCGY